MRIILDTNVLISGVFFSGPPCQILEAWRDGKVKLIVSPEIFEEYQRVGEELSGGFPSINIQAILDLVTIKAEMISAPPLFENVCKDPDDDKFLACAIASKCKMVISGDKQLLAVSEFRGIKVIKPREFLDENLLG